MIRWLYVKWFGWRAARRLRRHGLAGIYVENLRLLSEGREPHRAW